MNRFILILLLALAAPGLAWGADPRGGGGFDRGPPPSEHGRPEYGRPRGPPPPPPDIWWYRPEWCYYQ